MCRSYIGIGCEMLNKVICVVGMGSTGASAVVDYIKEFDDYAEFDVEFRVIMDPDGIMDLENALVKNWNYLNVDIAIKRFKRLINVLAKNSGKFSKVGLNYNELISPEFEMLSNEYVENLLDFRYDGGHWHGVDYEQNLNYIDTIINKFKRKLEYRNTHVVEYFACPEKKFGEVTQKYIGDLTKSCSKHTGKNNLIIDQGCSAWDLERCLSYFDNAKAIVVDRDPRDIFVESINIGWSIGRECEKPGGVEKFIKFHEKARQRFEKQNFDNENIMVLNFEDLILNYENTCETIRQFIGEEHSNHVHPLKFLNPSISKKNVGLWEKYKNQNDIDKIFKSLKKYCYNKEKLELYK